MRFGVIIADCPWRYKNWATEGAIRSNFDPDRHYRTMPDSDLLALPVADVAAADCTLLMWATWPKLKLAMDVVESWGFRQVTGFHWLKIVGLPKPDLFGNLHLLPQFGAGWWVRGCSEPILLCQRGSSTAPESRANLGIISENFGHSRKPDNLHEYAEQLPGPYLELFARRGRDGWTCLGNEIDGRDIRESLAELARR